MPADDQLALSFDSSSSLRPGPVPHLCDEIARAWGLPLDERVEITFRPGFPLASISDPLELRTAPDVPWNPRHPLARRVAGQDFTSRDSDHWKLVSPGAHTRH